MKISSLSHLALKHIRNYMAEEILLKTGYDLTRPVFFYGLVNERCNVKCRHCAYWRLEHYVEEMTIEEWQEALLSIKDFVGSYSINFSGGEPFLKVGFVDLMVWCHKNGIHSGVTTNGSALNKKIARKIVEARPFNVNISVDGSNAVVHDYLRGHSGLFQRLKDGITYLRLQQSELGVRFPIMIKTTINSRNFRQLPDIVEWAEAVGASCINFQPLERWTPETYDELWIEEEQLPELQRVIDRLLHMRRHGASILNSERMINLIVHHFREGALLRSNKANRLAMENLLIRANGEVELGICAPATPVGNIKRQTAREIWYTEKAREVRRAVAESRTMRLNSALFQRSLLERVGMGFMLLRD